MIPECNITLENSFTLVRECPEKLLDIDHGCLLLGTVCERTVRRHYKLAKDYIHLTTPFLTAWLAAHPVIADMPVVTPGLSPMLLYVDTFSKLVTAQEKRAGAAVFIPGSWVFPGHLMGVKKVRKTLPTPLNLVCLIGWYFDTS